MHAQVHLCLCISLFLSLSLFFFLIFCAVSHSSSPPLFLSLSAPSPSLTPTFPTSKHSLPDNHCQRSSKRSTSQVFIPQRGQLFGLCVAACGSNTVASSRVRKAQCIRLKSLKVKNLGEEEVSAWQKVGQSQQVGSRSYFCGRTRPNSTRPGSAEQWWAMTDSGHQRC